MIIPNGALVFKLSAQIKLHSEVLQYNSDTYNYYVWPCGLRGKNKNHKVGLYRLRGGRFKTEMRRNYFSQRVENLWNSLPQSAVESESLVSRER